MLCTHVTNKYCLLAIDDLRSGSCPCKLSTSADSGTTVMVGLCCDLASCMVARSSAMWAYAQTVGRVAASFYTVSKKLHFCFCQNFVKFFMNFNKFWKIDSKVTEIVCYIYIYIFHLTWPTSLRYLVKRDVVNFYPTLDLLQSDWSDLVLKWRGHTVVTT